ncbi:TetR/AcrR family transcriptional regulator [Streptomyces niveus]|uniref:TetR/AcrR family transcriptional regulator n=1 Tax=Streptomyces niveus TaxID=193462 RepID=UPI0036D01820
MTPANGDRPLRADARRNRDLVLASAMRLLSDASGGSGPGGGGGGSPTLDAIAKDAGVGIGTLYRHFPTREALVEAVYRNELTAVCDAAPALLDELAPVDATRAWMDRYIDFMIAKQGMADALRAVIASGGNPYAHSRDLLGSAIRLLLDAGAANGALRKDVDADDVLVSISGVALVAGEPSMREQAGRLLDLLLDGLRYKP